MFTRTCICLKFQKRCIFCCYVIAIYKNFNLKSKSYISDLYNYEIYKQTYAIHIKLVVFENLKKFDKCIAFSKQRKVEHFKQKKIRRKRICTIVRKYNYCYCSNYTTRTCDQKL